MTETLLYTGKAKSCYQTTDPEVMHIQYMDQVTALNGKQKDQMAGKGALNNQITSLIFTYLKAHGIENHFIKQLSTTDQLVQKVTIIPLEVVTRNVAAGHFATRFGVKEGMPFKQPVHEFYFKSDELDDPFINDEQIIALNIAAETELNQLRDMAQHVNDVLIPLFKQADMDLIDFKLEFGKTSDGRIILADEISPDTCRLWNVGDHAHLDKDVYRRQIGDLIPIYETVLSRLQAITQEV